MRVQFSKSDYLLESVELSELTVARRDVIGTNV